MSSEVYYCSTICKNTSCNAFEMSEEVVLEDLRCKSYTKLLLFESIYLGDIFILEFSTLPLQSSA